MGKRRNNGNDEQVQLAEIRKDIQHLFEKVSEGFSGVHQRQDVTNGKVSKNSDHIAEIQNHVQSLRENTVSKDQYQQDWKDSAKKKIAAAGDWKIYAIKTFVGLCVALFLFWVGIQFGGG